MDQKTREARRRLKADRTPRGTLSPFEARGLGAKNKPHKTFPKKPCSHIEGGVLVFFKKRVIDKRGRESLKNGAILKGGVPCPKAATRTFNRENIAKGYCDDHKPEETPQELDD
jgi:hypothetical protein